MRMRKIGLETCFDRLKIRITRGRSISFKCSTRRNRFDCPCKRSTIYPCKIKSPVTPREYHLSLGIRGLLLLVIRNEDMLSLPADDVTPSQTTGFILTTPSICHSKLVHVSTRLCKVVANMARYVFGALIQKNRGNVSFNRNVSLPIDIVICILNGDFFFFNLKLKEWGLLKEIFILYLI